MGKSRLEAFSDGVLAIIVTIMVLELRVPAGESFEALRPLLPIFLAYVLSFVFVATYWNNHHHLFLTIDRVTAGILWANMALLFCLSLIPFGTAWMGETRLAPVPTLVYCAILLLAGAAYWLLQIAIVAAQGEDSVLARALGADRKGKATLVILVLTIACALWVPIVSAALCAVVDVIWVVPDRRIERALAATPDDAAV